jgi:peptidyl-tRNA hydrolase
LGDFKKTEALELKKIIKKAVLALEKVIQDGWSVAASQLGNL